MPRFFFFYQSAGVLIIKCYVGQADRRERAEFGDEILTQV